jgi:Fe-S-cluster containining protein
MWQCKQCGACCKVFGLIGIKVDFPFAINDGICEKLVDNKCSIYADRPDCCRYDKWKATRCEQEKEIMMEESCKHIRSLVYDKVHC